MTTATATTTYIIVKYRYTILCKKKDPENRYISNYLEYTINEKKQGLFSKFLNMQIQVQMLYCADL